MVAAVVGATVVGGYLASENSADAAASAAGVQSSAALQSADIQAGASDRAAQIQQQTSREAMAQRQQQFDIARGLLQPWVDQGNTARGAQSDLIGLNGGAPQQAAIDALKNSPAFTSLHTAGTNAILQNASATGGLRGGNVEGAVAQYDPALLSALIDQQYGRLTGVANAGQNAAAGVGSAAINIGNAQAGDLTGAGNAAAAGINNAAAASAGGINNAASAGAGGILGQARAENLLINSAVNAAGVYAGARPAATNPGAGYSGGLNPATGTSFGPTFANG